MPAPVVESTYRPEVHGPIVVLDESAGLVGSPSATETGARAKMLLNTDLHLEQLVEIKSELLSGMFVISSITHRGDTRSGEFVTEIEGSTFEPPTPVGSAAQGTDPNVITLPGGRN